MDIESLNVSQLAQALGKTRPTIYAWVRQGMPRGEDKTFHLPSVVEWLRRREWQLAIEQERVD